LRLAWVLAAALPLAPHVQARDGDCDALLGSYALAPKGEAMLRVERADGAGYVVSVLSGGQVERTNVARIPPGDYTESGHRDEAVCALKGEGVTLVKLRRHSPLNVTEDPAQAGRTPGRTPFFLIVTGGGAAGEVPIYPVRHRGSLSKDLAAPDE
ncbi:hypothetical protein HF319_16680, partial [Xanthomonas sp. Kuri4-1]